LHESPLFLEEASLEWKEGEPFSNKYQDRYFSKFQALEEAEYVFIKANNLLKRWKNLKENENFKILELGFGAGINFLMTIRSWSAQDKKNNWLNYVSIENNPLKIEDLKKIIRNYPELKDLAEKLIQSYPVNSKGIHRIEFKEEKVLLNLCFDEVNRSLKDLDPEKLTIDSIFHDGFSPSKNPEIWSNEIFQYLEKFSDNSTTYSTFSSAKLIRERLLKNGFRPILIKGFGTKKKMIKANLIKKENKKVAYKRKKIAVIGAGISGCSLSKILSDRGHKITLFEKNKNFLEDSEGFKAFVVHPRLSAFEGQLSRLNLNSYLYSTNFYDNLGSPHWNKTGVLSLNYDEITDKRHKQLIEARNDTRIFSYVDKDEASFIAGIKIDTNGLFFKEAGWLNPVGIKKDLIDSSDIKLINDEVLKVNKNKVFTESEEKDFDVVCLCSSFENNGLIKINGINKKRGQVSYIKNEGEIKKLKVPVCANGYIVQTSISTSLVGSTYNDIEDKDPLKSDDLENLEKVTSITKQKFKLKDAGVGFRATTRDYLPIVGNLNGILLNIGHGSRGSITGPFCSQYISDVIDESPTIFGKRLSKALDPKRFIAQG
tara:strand:+ start:5469 stop:7265 length:1797 start_codon:yes stop_codon:yes gene_type:complete